MRKGYWVLDENKHPKEVSSVEEWGQFFESPDRIVKQETINGSRISTVFLGVDHSFGSGPPMFFETMVFEGEHDGYQTRCSTWEQAKEMHRKACAIVRGDETEDQR